MGYARHNHAVLVTHNDSRTMCLVGHTTHKSKEMAKKPMDGVMLADETYYLYTKNKDGNYGQESIEIILSVMDNNSKDLVVAVAGYNGQMNTFFSYISGMIGQIGNSIDFSNYTSTKSVKISEVVVRDLEYNIDETTYSSFHDYISARMELSFFPKTRTIQNTMNLVRMNSAI